FYVQDLSSMQVATKANLKGGEKVLDVCAAPGGKSLHIAEMLSMLENGETVEERNLKSETVEERNVKSGTVEARDLTADKVKRIEENIRRTGLGNISAKVFDATKFDEAARNQYDVVVCDLPCSGLGVIGKKPEIKYRVQPEDLDDLAKLQKNILKNAKDYVKEHGRLIFSTCTINKTENDENTKWFLEEFPEFSLVSEEQIFPKKDEWDGFYIALFEK
nr:methyltransferase domain-containing protein [Lachnospiraceae bacterium]